MVIAILPVRPRLATCCYYTTGMLALVALKQCCSASNLQSYLCSLAFKIYQYVLVCTIAPVSNQCDYAQTTGCNTDHYCIRNKNKTHNTSNVDLPQSTMIPNSPHPPSLCHLIVLCLLTAREDPTGLAYSDIAHCYYKFMLHIHRLLVKSADWHVKIKSRILLRWRESVFFQCWHS